MSYGTGALRKRAAYNKRFWKTTDRALMQAFLYAATHDGVKSS